MICTAPYAMLLMRANLLRGQVGEGWTLQNRDFFLFGTCEMASSRLGVLFGAQNSQGLYQSEVYW
jgi:hypothetical protein